MRLRSKLAASTAAALVLVTFGAATTAATTSSIECGQVTAYTAPDPSGPTDGAFGFGMLSPWVVLADATVSAEAASALPSLVNSGPTCVAVDFDVDGAITALDFAVVGSLTGMVTYDPGTAFYWFVDRMIIPTFVTDAYPGLAVLFAASYQAGTELNVIFTVDPTTGRFTGFNGHAAFCGLGSIATGGDGQVGDAIIPASLLDAADIAALEGAGDRETCVTVHSYGTIDPGDGSIASVSDIVITVAADPTAALTPPPTTTADVDPSTQSTDTHLVGTLLMLLGGVSLILSRKFRPTP